MHLGNYKIHNKFEIQVISNDNIVQEYVTYNVVTDLMRTEMLKLRYTSSGKGIVTNIVVGDGTGDPQSSDTTLFKALKSYSSASDGYGQVSNTTWYSTRKITIEPSDLVGKTITEVGFGTTSAVYTHAMIKDSQGSPVGIYKTDNDKLVIRATLYLTLDVPTGCHIATETSLNYKTPTIPIQFSSLLLNDYIYSGSLMYYLNNSKPLCDDSFKQSSGLYEYSMSSTTVTDNSMGTVTWTIPLSSTVGNNKNYHALQWKSSSSTTFGAVTFPLQSSDFNGVEYTNVTLGDGDGNTVDFEIPYIYQRNNGITVKVNGEEVSDYKIIKSYGVDSMLMGAPGDSAFSIFKPKDLDKYYRVTHYYYSSDNTATATTDMTWNDEMGIFISSNNHDGGSTANYTYRAVKSLSWLSEEGLWVYKTGFKLYNFDFEKNIKGTLKYSGSGPSSGYLFKIEGTTDKYMCIGEKGYYSTATKIYNVEDNTLVAGESIPSTTGYLYWCNKSNVHYGSIGNMFLSSTTNLHIWDSILQNYKYQTLPVGVIGLVDYNIGINLVNSELIEYKFNESYEVEETNVIATGVSSAYCLWLPNEDKGCVMYSLVGATSDYDGIYIKTKDDESGKYITTMTRGYYGLITRILGSSTPYGGVQGQHPEGGYIFSSAHIKPVDAVVRFNKPILEGDSVTIDVNTKYLYKTDDMLVDFKVTMQC